MCIFTLFFYPNKRNVWSLESSEPIPALWNFQCRLHKEVEEIKCQLRLWRGSGWETHWLSVQNFLLGSSWWVFFIGSDTLLMHTAHFLLQKLNRSAVDLIALIPPIFLLLSYSQLAHSWRILYSYYVHVTVLQTAAEGAPGVLQKYLYCKCMKLGMNLMDWCTLHFHMVLFLTALLWEKQLLSP